MQTKQTKTETRIKAAVVQLLQDKSFEQITISDITRTAKINRGTFYLHYLDKYDLLKHYENTLYKAVQELCDELASSMTRQSIAKGGVLSYTIVSRIVDLVATEFPLIQVLFGPNGDPKFEPRVRNILQTAISEAVYRIKGTRQLTPKIPTAYAWELTISGLFDIIKCWLRQSKPETPEQITDIIVKTRYMTPADLLGLDIN